MASTRDLFVGVLSLSAALSYRHVGLHFLSFGIQICMKLTTTKYMYILTLADKSLVLFLRCCHLCVVGLTLDLIQYTQSKVEDRLGEKI